jgi:hypothetical protein
MRIPFLRAAAGLLVAAGVIAAEARAGDYLNPPTSGPVVVTNDHGGLFKKYEKQTLLYRTAGREVRIKGVCTSACTIALSLDKVCVYRKAVLKFHQAFFSASGYYIPVEERKLSPEEREAGEGVSAQLFISYPERVRDRLGELTPEMKTLQGGELIALGIKECTEKSPILSRVARTQQHKAAHLVH